MSCLHKAFIGIPINRLASSRYEPIPFSVLGWSSPDNDLFAFQESDISLNEITNILFYHHAIYFVDIEQKLSLFAVRSRNVIEEQISAARLIVCNRYPPRVLQDVPNHSVCFEMIEELIIEVLIELVPKADHRFKRKEY